MATNRKFSAFNLFNKQVKKDVSQQAARQIPFVPKGVDISTIDFDAKGITILNKVESKQLKEAKFKFKNSRYSKSEVGSSFPYVAIECDKMTWLICSKKIGSGLYGRVKVVFNTKTRQFYALKLQNAAVKASVSDQQKMMEKTRQELNTIQMLKQTPQKEFILQRYANDKTIPQIKTLQTLMIMDFVPGLGVDEILKKEEKTGHFIPTALRFHIARELFKAINKLHVEQHLIHGDLSLTNVKVDFTSQVVNLIDFGNSIDLFKATSKKNSSNKDELTLEEDLRAAIHVVGALFYLDKNLPLSENPLVKQGLISESTLQYILKLFQQNFSFEQLIQLLNAIEQKEETKSDKLQVGIVNIQDLLNAETKANLISQLKTMDEVWFVDTHPDTDMKTILTLKAELEEADIVVGNEFFIGQKDELLKEQVQEHLKTRTVKADCQLHRIQPMVYPNKIEYATQ